MRLFVAIELPNEIKDELASLQKELRQAQAEVSWTKPENLHLTLKFLGEVGTERVEQIEQAYAEAARASKPLSLATHETGFFPNLRRPRVVWAGLQGDLDELLALQNKLETQFATLGFTHELKPFQPHLTLGRIKTTKNVAPLVARAEAYQLPTLSFTASELVLMQSQLHPGGSIYTPLSRARFGTM
jgi:2'-5' RNA ligase